MSQHQIFYEAKELPHSYPTPAKEADSSSKPYNLKHISNTRYIFCQQKYLHECFKQRAFLLVFILTTGCRKSNFEEF